MKVVSGVTCTSPTASNNALVQYMFSSTVYTVGVYTYKGIIGPVSGDLYEYGGAEDGSLSQTYIARSTYPGTRSWAFVYSGVEPMKDAFIMDSTETFLYFLEMSQSDYTRITQINTADGSVASSKHSPVVGTAVAGMQMSFVESANTIFWTSPNIDGGFTGGICKYTVGGSTFQCFKTTNFNSTHAISGITGNVIYFVTKHSSADTIAFIKGDFSVGSI